MAQPMHCYVQIRNYILRRTPKSWKKDEHRYELVKYYPRHKDHKDPQIAPTKLLMVKRVKPYKGNPYWEKYILDHIRLNEVSSDIAIVKNTPEICQQLWTIKHLVNITPINLPTKLPDNLDSVQTWLHENGDLLLAPPVDQAREKATEEFQNNPKKLDRKTLRAEMRMRWLMPWGL